MHATTRGVRRFGELRQSVYVTVPPKRTTKAEPRPYGWNAEVAADRAAARKKKVADRKARRDAGRGEGRPFLRMIGVPAWMNRRTGKAHEHNRVKAKHGKAA